MNKKKILIIVAIIIALAATAAVLGVWFTNNKDKNKQNDDEIQVAEQYHDFKEAYKA